MLIRFKHLFKEHRLFNKVKWFNYKYYLCWQFVIKVNGFCFRERLQKGTICILAI